MSKGASAKAETGSREPGLASRPGPAGFDPARDKTQLLIADADKPLAYLELDDATLGKFARWHLIETNRAAGRDAVGRDMPLVVSLAMHAKVALAHLYSAVFGECNHIWEMHLQGLSWKGQPNGGDWRITVQRLPAIATEAGTATTVEQGAGPKDIAHTPPPSERGSGD